MRRLSRIPLAAGLLASVVGCPSLNGPPQQNIIWETQLVPVSSEPGLGGQAAMVAQLGGTDVGIGITGAQPGATHTWQVHAGTCAAPGGGVGPPGDYPDLLVDATGGATAETHINRLLSADSSYYAEVRLSSSDTTRIACGDFQQRATP